jgi:hypothetical protein
MAECNPSQLHFENPMTGGTMLDMRRVRRWSPLCLTMAVVVLAGVAILTGAPAEAALPALLLLGAVAALTHGMGRQ